MSLKASSIELWVSALEKVKQSGSGYKSLCPCHEDRSASFVFKEDDSTAYGIQFKCLAGCDSILIVEELRNIGLLQSDGNGGGKENKLYCPCPPKFDDMDYVCHYTYKDEEGQILFYVGRYEKGTKKQTIPFAGKPDDDWKWWKAGLKQFKERGRPLYNLEKACRANEIFIVEGEKCVDAMAKIGIIATCCVGGSGATELTDWTPLRGKIVYVWRDRDEPGAKFEYEVKKIMKNINIDIQMVDISKLK